MRPLSLRLRRFGPFADQTIDFRELDGLTELLVHGPTGSGKTTIVDAIFFALYGESSGGERSQEDLRPRESEETIAANLPSDVSFAFSIGNESFRAERSLPRIRRKRRGEGFVSEPSVAALLSISDPEDEIGKPIASGASAVTEAVRSLTGLSAEEFRQVAVLPQGRFRAFLAADSAARQTLLEKLFDVSAQERTERLLRSRATAAQAEKDAAEVRLSHALAKLGIVAPEEVDGLIALRRMKAENAEAFKESVRNEAAKGRGARRDRLRAAVLRAALARADEDVAEAEERLGRCERAAERAEKIGRILNERRTIAERDEATTARLAAENALRLTLAVANDAATRVTIAERAERSLDALLALAKHLPALDERNADDRLSESLEKAVAEAGEALAPNDGDGERRTFLAGFAAGSAAFPKIAAAVISELIGDAALPTRNKDALERAASVAAEAERSLRRAEADLERAVEREAIVGEAVSSLPKSENGAEENEAALLPDAERRVTEALSARAEACERLNFAKREREARAEALAKIAGKLPDGDDPEKDEADEAEPDEKEMEGELESAIERAVEAAAALRMAENGGTEIKEAVARLEGTRRLASIAGEAHAIASGDNPLRLSFRRHALAAKLDEAIDAANSRLNRMTGGRFLLGRRIDGPRHMGRADGLELEVIDPGSGATRGTSSLSGGESFVASLALALGLADVAAERSGGAGSETLFVDEGFGSLDPDGLDLAMETLERESGGRLLCLVSHVPDMILRVPARLRVRKEGGVSVAAFEFG
jgi:exonuclease SbcC